MKTNLFLTMILASVMSFGAFAQTAAQGTEMKKEEKIVKTKKKHGKKIEEKKVEKVEEKKEEAKK